MSSFTEHLRNFSCWPPELQGEKVSIPAAGSNDFCKIHAVMPGNAYMHRRWVLPRESTLVFMEHEWRKWERETLADRLNSLGRWDEVTEKRTTNQSDFMFYIYSQDRCAWYWFDSKQNSWDLETVFFCSCHGNLPGALGTCFGFYFVLLLMSVTRCTTSSSD